MELLPGIEIRDLALWLKEEKILVISDLHLGYEGMMEEQGLLLPKFQLKDILEKLKKILKHIPPQKIIINGDLKHEYGKILSQEWREVLRLIDFLLENCQELIMVKGNHDLFLGPIAKKKGIKLVKDYLAKDILICHGDEVKKTSARTVILGHEHPAIVLKEKNKKEKYKCFLKGKFKGKNLLVMPSFNPLFEGADVLKQELLSPYLKNISDARKRHKPFPASRKSFGIDFQDFEVYAVGEKVYQFGKVKNLLVK